MPISVKNSCPNCEYERGNAGKPVANGERMTCLECGTNWKELSGTPALRSARHDNSQTMDLLKELARKGAASSGEDPIGTNQADTKPHQTGHWAGALHAALFSIALVGGIGFTVWCLGSASTSAIHAEKTVSVSGIKVSEQIGRNGRKVITVAGSINNSTDRHHAIPRVAIILKRKDGGEIVRWRYNPPASSISPGGTTRFASSIQYDTPVVAYAEAIIE